MGSLCKVPFKELTIFYQDSDDNLIELETDQDLEQAHQYVKKRNLACLRISILERREMANWNISQN